MKRILILICGLMAASSGAKAQLFSDNQLGGALLGGVIGGVVGHNNNRKTAEGVGIGAGVGYLLGSLNDYGSQNTSGYGGSRISVGYGYGGSRYGRHYGGHHRRHHHYYSGHHGPRFGISYSTYPSYRTYPTYGAYTTYPSYAYTTPAYTTTTYTTERRRPNYALSGAAAGGILGAVIGHNSNRQTAEGAAIGAGAGLLLGGLAEREARRNEAAVAAQQAARTQVLTTQPRQTSLYAPGVITGRTPVAAAAGETKAQGSPAPLAPAGYNAMSGANRLFGR